MDDKRITKRVFIHDHNLCNNNRPSEVKLIMIKLGLQNHFATRATINFNIIQQEIHDF